MEPVWRGIRGWPASDFLELAGRAGEWPKVLSQLRVFEFSEKYAAHGDFADIHTLVAMLQSHDVQIAMQGIPLVASRRCGLGVESYGSASETLVAGRRLEQAGAHIRAIVFDEPLYYGHVFVHGKTTTGCLLSIPDAIGEVVARENDLRHAFPGVRIGDVEPFGLTDISGGAWGAVYEEWLRDYKLKAGHAWDFVQADVVWTRPGWAAPLRTALEDIEASHIPWGVYYTGAAADRSGTAWARNVIADDMAFREAIAGRPDHVVIASWNDYPRHLLPESDPSTFLGAALDYLHRRQ